MNIESDKAFEEQIKSSNLKINSVDAYERFIESIKPEEEYADYLKGKRVVIVGPSKYMLDPKLSNHGKVIDNYDVITRIKCLKHFDKMREKEGFLGNRTDVVYNWMYFSAEMERNEIKDSALAEHNIKYFRVPKSEPWSEKHIKKYGTKKSDHFPSHYIGSCKHTEFDCSGFKNYCNSLNLDYAASPQQGSWYPLHRKPALQTGTAGVMELIASECKEIYITGLTYYHGGDHMFAYKSFTDGNPISGKHNGAIEMRLLIDSLLYEIETRDSLDRIKVDSVMKFIVLKYIKTLQEIEHIGQSGRFKNFKGMTLYNHIKGKANSIKASVFKKFGITPWVHLIEKTK